MLAIKQIGMFGYKILTKLVVLVHLIFILYVVFGALLIFRWNKNIFIHLPAFAWGALVEYLNIICPLTPLENYFRKMAGLSTYSAGFIDRYITPIIYPENLEHNTQFLFGSIVLIMNVLLYTFIFIKVKRKKNENLTQ